MSSPGQLQTRPTHPCLDGWLGETKALSAAADRREERQAASATTAVGAPAAASPRSGAAVRGADGPPIKIYSEKEKLRC